MKVELGTQQWSVKHNMSEFVDAMLSHIRNNLSNTFTAMPAYITDVSKLESENLVSVQPALGVRMSDGTEYEFGIIPDLTVQWPSGGGALLSFPLAVGDDVLLVFSMRSIAEWEDSGSSTVVYPEGTNLHDIADAFVQPCVYRNANNPSPNPDDVEIKYNGSTFKLTKDGKITADTTAVQIGTDTVAVTNTTGELLDLLTQCLQTISDTTVNTIYGVSPLNSKPAIDALITQIETFKE